MLFQCHKESHAGNLRVLQKRKEKKRKEKKRKEKRREEKRREEKRKEKKSEVTTEGADVNDL